MKKVEEVLSRVLILAAISGVRIGFELVYPTAPSIDPQPAKSMHKTLKKTFLEQQTNRDGFYNQFQSTEQSLSQIVLEKLSASPSASLSTGSFESGQNHAF